MKNRLVVGVVMMALALGLPGLAVAQEGSCRDTVRHPMLYASAIVQSLWQAIDAILMGSGEAPPSDAPSAESDIGDETPEPIDGPSPPEEMGGGTDPLG